jgi:hypothetical protein
MTSCACLGINLHGSLQDSADTHVDRRADEDSTQPCGCQKHKQSVDRVGADDYHSIALLDAACFERGCEAASILAQCSPRNVADLSIALTYLCNSNLIVLLTSDVPMARDVGGATGEEYILSPVNVDAGEPAGDRINGSRLIDNSRRGAGVDYVCPVKQLCVEGGAMFGGIFVQILE